MSGPAPAAVVAFDKFRGTATAMEINEAAARAARAVGWTVRVVPLADGGEGSLEVLGGPNRTTVVDGPLGEEVAAGWRLEGDTAYLEMARASGLELVGGAAGNDPERASTAGTGQLIEAALDEGARRIVVFVGGSATTDGGAGAVSVIAADPRIREVALVVAADVTTPFLAAADVFGPQKGADPATVERLRDRLGHLADRYRKEFGIDVTAVPGSGAAGGLAGGLVALGADIVPGFDLLAEVSGLLQALPGAELVVTGEGKLDRGSFQGKVVGGVVRAAGQANLPVLAVVGVRDPDVPSLDRLEVVTLADRFGLEAARHDPCGGVATVVGEYLNRMHLAAGDR